LEVGKTYFYNAIKSLSRIELTLFKGYETYKLRNSLGLKKSKKKLERGFEAHCVDSWVMCYHMVGGDNVADNTQVMYISPIVLHRRQLHVFNPTKGNIRKPYGGTRSLGLKRGSLVKHNKYGYCYVGGTSKERISIHNINTGERLAQNIKVEDLKFKSYSSWKYITI
jgi:hypothetical protein